MAFVVIPGSNAADRIAGYITILPGFVRVLHINRFV
jgi:hypothetical protein